MTGSGSVAFDRAAAFYDSTRGLSPEVERAVVQRLAPELDGVPGRLLEIGVGTGRMALPLTAAGFEMAGIDLSRPMLDVLLEKAGGRVPFPLAVADATRLPFPGATFGAALACHVLHLIRGWADALAELVRVVRPDAPVLVDLGGQHHWAGQLQDQFQRQAGVPVGRVGLTDPGLLDQAMAAHGRRGRELAPVVQTRTISVGAIIDAYEANLFAWTWDMDDATRHRAATGTRAWAVRHLGALDQPRPLDQVIAWRVYR